jgi:ribosomal protein S18 acetylase RimI-like enzyme
MEIIQADTENLDDLSQLFDQYRIFYAQKSDVENAKAFLEKRITQNESVIFIAIQNGEYVAFTQLYPSFSSVSMSKIWILNDLFVIENYRKQGVAEQLIKHVINYCKTTGRKKVALSTAYDNVTAQKLYHKIGFSKDDYFNYEITV